MIHYEVRNDEAFNSCFRRIRIELNDRHRYHTVENAKITLWQVERESEAEAAVRRMSYLEEKFNKMDRDEVGVLTLKLRTSHLPLSGAIDSECPPPAPKETQLDWNTGEPIRAVKTWQESSGVWLACVSDSSPARIFCSCLVSGKMASGHTRDAAIANLNAIQQAIKS
jgi:hypothetical protein